MKLILDPSDVINKSSKKPISAIKFDDLTFHAQSVCMAVWGFDKSAYIKIENWERDNYNRIIYPE